MKRIAASLAAVLATAAALGLAGCGTDGAEPDAPDAGARTSAGLDPLELVLDFQPNAVHSGIYAAVRDGLFADRGVAVEIRAPGASTDAPKLLRSGRADLAILDIHDLAIAREQGLDLIGVAAIVQRPLAAVIAADRRRIRTPADLEGTEVGVTGLPSDEAVLESVLAAGDLGADDVETTTIGFDAVPALLGGRLDAVTAFWNAEGITLRQRLPTREFRVDRFGAPPYPELVLTTTPEALADDRAGIEAAIDAIGAGYAEVVADPERGLDALTEAVPELDRSTQQAELEALRPALGDTRAFDRRVLERWADWELDHGIVDRRPEVGDAFDFSLAGSR